MEECPVDKYLNYLCKVAISLNKTIVETNRLAIVRGVGLDWGLTQKELALIDCEKLPLKQEILL